MRVIIVGGGAAGQLAAICAAESGASVAIFEKNEKLGKKVYITGKGRCNLTNAAEKDDFFKSVVRNPKFLFSALNTFNNEDIIRLIESHGVPCKTERGGRVFPASDKSSDVLKALRKCLDERNIEIHLNTNVQQILVEEGRIKGIVADNKSYPSDAVIMASGGVSYPQTGSTGDGYRFARNLGHTVVETKPSLVGLNTEETWPGELTGLTLKNVKLTAKKNGKTVFKDHGELLLTHFGISGPLVLTLSSIIAKEPEHTDVSIDLKPALDEKTLDERICRDIMENRHKSVKNAMHSLLPERLLEIVLSIAGISPDTNVDSFSKAQRRALVETLKCINLKVNGTQPIEEAIITCGGINVKEVNSSTMESKIVSGLYFAGEILDVDAFTGGYNLQIAWSTGALAGRSAGKNGESD